jgi:hypothetical protein
VSAQLAPPLVPVASVVPDEPVASVVPDDPVASVAPLVGAVVDVPSVASVALPVVLSIVVGGSDPVIVSGTPYRSSVGQAVNASVAHRIAAAPNFDPAASTSGSSQWGHR